MWVGDALVSVLEFVGGSEEHNGPNFGWGVKVLVMGMGITH